MIAATVVDHNQFWHVIIDHHKTQNLLMLFIVTLNPTTLPLESEVVAMRLTSSISVLRSGSATQRAIFLIRWARS